jgi:hypothetical protein
VPIATRSRPEESAREEKADAAIHDCLAAESLTAGRLIRILPNWQAFDQSDRRSREILPCQATRHSPSRVPQRPVWLSPPRGLAQGSPKHRLEAPEGVRLALTGGAPAQVSGGGLGHTPLESSIEVGSDAAAGPETGQHDCWTAPPTTRILMAG